MAWLISWMVHGKFGSESTSLRSCTFVPGEPGKNMLSYFFITKHKDTKLHKSQSCSALNPEHEVLTTYLSWQSLKISLLMGKVSQPRTRAFSAFSAANGLRVLVVTA